MKKILFSLYFIGLCNAFVYGQQNDSIITKRLNTFFNQYTECFVKPKLSFLKIDYNSHTLSVCASESFAYQPFRVESVSKIYQQIKELLPDSMQSYKISIECDGKTIEELIPNYYRKHIKKDKSRLETELEYKGKPWIVNLSKPYIVTEGLQNRYIGLWQSHGRYYNNANNEWSWQRPRLFCTTEDLFSQSFVVPYIIPMLEHSGATIVTPRERDIQHNEVIVDNDSYEKTSTYIEHNSRKNTWGKCYKNGFANSQKTYKDEENPFTTGTTRFINAEKKANRAFIEWIPNIPESGKYAVYLSYQSLPNSVTDAHYTVYHKGEKTEYKINQQMGGNTWVYLGTFDFDAGVKDYDKVILTNESNEKGIITADAIRFGGGMGNIIRGNTTSGLPRYLEGARYSAQWNGMPTNVYDIYKNTNDYSDDINTRGLMINYLSGGSIYNQEQKGLKIPIELSLAFHTDAGNDPNNYIGSLGIYTTNFYHEKLNSGTSRYASRDLCDIILSQIKQDIDTIYQINWQRRAMWNRNYSESRLPGVPSIILEMFSHQNFQDMKLGHDPNFKFTISRAIYKGILRFIASEHKKNYEIQPLPVSHFAIKFGKIKNTLELSWQGENDILEPTASPSAYIIYTRKGNGSFDNGTIVNTNKYISKIVPNNIYSYYVTAINSGGESFPSEILSAMRRKKDKLKALIVNGFNRLSAPYIVEKSDSLGFDLDKDPGVSYGENISLCGRQSCYNKEEEGKEGVGSLGYSTNELEGKIIAGNTFDYTYIHGRSIQANKKWSYVSSSREAFEDLIEDNEPLIKPDKIKLLAGYQCIDILFGLQKRNKDYLKYYPTFSTKMQGILRSYSMIGGNIFISGSYIASDMNNNEKDKTFCTQVLKYGYKGSVNNNDSLTSIISKTRNYNVIHKMNDKIYAITSPDILNPYENAVPIMYYYPSKAIAAIMNKNNKYKTFVLGFPFETITDEEAQKALMADILDFFTKKK